jgi:hypothetical protein
MRSMRGKHAKEVPPRKGKSNPASISLEHDMDMFAAPVVSAHRQFS